MPGCLTYNWLDVTFWLPFGRMSDSASGVCTKVVGRAGTTRGRGLCAGALVIALLYLQFMLLNKHESPGTCTGLGLIFNDDILGQGCHNAF